MTMTGKIIDGIFYEYTPEEQAEHDAKVVAQLEYEKDLAWYYLRSKRNYLLTASDWVVTRSVEFGTPIPDDVISFREALRTIAVGLTDPSQAVWPPIPEIVAKSLLDQPTYPSDPVL